ncbi:hypothetical protein GE061_018837 [Apolygus lucorum]|uniref:Uncharacterized protein n=1 Tax=Apolygus lucorum TaxID=248454 RepID=A0A8S9X9D3_APOLU|nr:hypothetical protein GE061_018837 [Apolygus lucorum]
MEEAIDEDSGVGMPELEFLSEELTIYECRELAKTLDLVKRVAEIEGEDRTCLDDLVKYVKELTAEGPDVVQSVIRHKLANIGRKDLADWLSRAGNTKVVGNTAQRRQYNDDAAYDGSNKTEDVDAWTYLDFAICTLATWAFLTLAWLVIQLIVINMKATAMASMI